MPNWVYNGLTIEGKKESVIKLKEQMNKPFSLYHDSVWDNELKESVGRTVNYPNPVFAFWNIVPPTDLDAYKNQPAKANVDANDPNWWAETQKVSLTDNSWYNWNLRNWGVKWDVAVSSDNLHPDTYMEEHENGENYVVYYNFETAWSIPYEALSNLSSQYPDLLFTLSYEEETGWGGEMEILRGERISEMEYENQCRDCDAKDCMEYCENDCGEICSVCNWLGEADLDAVAECQTHSIYLETKVPEYRKADA
jgi:hypothetical protein